MTQSNLNENQHIAMKCRELMQKGIEYRVISKSGFEYWRQWFKRFYSDKMAQGTLKESLTGHLKNIKADMSNYMQAREDWEKRNPNWKEREA